MLNIMAYIEEWDLLVHTFETRGIHIPLVVFSYVPDKPTSLSQIHIGLTVKNLDGTTLKATMTPIQSHTDQNNITEEKRFHISDTIVYVDDLRPNIQQSLREIVTSLSYIFS